MVSILLSALITLPGINFVVLLFVAVVDPSLVVNFSVVLRVVLLPSTLFVTCSRHAETLECKYSVENSPRICPGSHPYWQTFLQIKLLLIKRYHLLDLSNSL